LLLKPFVKDVIGNSLGLYGIKEVAPQKPNLPNLC